MPNALFRAKEIWDGGDHERGLAILEEHLERELGEVAFEPEPRIFYPNAFGALEGAVFSMLDSPTMLKPPFGRVFAQIWELNPHSQWIGLLRHHEFTDPLDYEEFADLDLPPVDFAFETLVEALANSARRGLLAPDFEGPNNGRPVLRLNDIEAVDEASWGTLKSMLATALRQAYATCPPDFWERLVVDDAEGVLTRFLHDLFLDHRPPLDVAEARWTVILEQQPAYAAAAQSALRRVRAFTYPSGYLTELVRVDAGFRVDNGNVWLDLLQERLVESTLRALPGQRWPPGARS